MLSNGWLGRGYPSSCIHVTWFTRSNNVLNVWVCRKLLPNESAGKPEAARHVDVEVLPMTGGR